MARSDLLSCLLHQSKLFDVASLLFVVLLYVHADKDTMAVRLVVDAAHVLAPRDSGGQLGDFTPAAKALEVLSDEGAHVDLDEAAEYSHGCLEVGHHLNAI